jgi:lipopolysaccharide transport system ATP-binding protein
MYVRLAFAVAAYLESDILIVDEILAVGDTEFQKKCVGKMDEVSKGYGRTILFVSHQMNSIRSLCSNCILLKNGRVENIGLTDTIVQQYLNESNSNKNIKFYDKHLKYVRIEQKGSKIIIEVEYSAGANLDVPHFGFIIYNSDSQPIFASNPSLEQMDYNTIGKSKEGKILIDIESPQLIDGKYHASIWFGDSKENFIEDLDSIVFEVAGMTKNKQYIQSFTGNVIPKTKWNFIKL